MMRLLVVAVSIGVVALAFISGRQSSRPPIVSGELQSTEALRRALEEPDDLLRVYLYSAYLQGLDASNLARTLETIDASGRRLTNREVELLMLAWSRFDPDEAFSLALFSADKEGRRGAGAALYAWATHDPVAAQAALFGLKGDRLAEYLQGRFVAGWVRGGGLADATRFVDEMPTGPNREFLTGVIADELVKTNAAAVIEWAEAIPAEAREGYKSTVFKRSTATLARVDPRATARWLGRHVDAEYAQGCIWVLAWNWVESDPRATLRWLESLSPGTRRTEAVRKTFAQWLRSDRDQAESWLGAAEPSATLDPAVRLIVMQRLDESPAAAVDWVRRIHDRGARERLMVRIGKSWMKQDPDAARRWIDSSGLPPAARRAIANSKPS
ncbi:MAG: hypothetical protein JRH17_13070 [Deltaproteobacteria bacterium]|nr:hypothetical protein [Deltaproteobacteria bacterium]MBW2695079.1 hypothetical protein [Deltaproteobacteria bacterium]